MGGNLSAQLSGGAIGGVSLSGDRLCAGSASSPNVATIEGLIEEHNQDPLAHPNGGGSGDGRRYSLHFEDGALTGGNLLIAEHNLNTIPASVIVFDANGEQIEPDRIGYLSNTTIFVDLESFRPLTGSYTLIIRS